MHRELMKLEVGLIVEDLERLDDLENYGGEWMNLTFDIKGKSYRGYYHYDSEEAALAGQIDFMRWIRGRPNGERFLMTGCGTELSLDEVSHVIQIPVEG